MGLLPRDQLDLAGYAFSAYKKASSDSQRSGDGTGDSGLREAWHFRQIAGGRLIQIEFIGVWDTVGAVGIPEDLAKNFLHTRRERRVPLRSGLR